MPTPGGSTTLALRCLNHISRVCKDVQASAAFYRDVLGFNEVKRPSSFEFEGAWLFNYGIGIHLIAGQPVPRNRKIEPKSDHLSFQVDCLDTVERQLQSLGLDYVKQLIKEAGVLVTQLFFHDPDDNMIEICNCDLLPVVLLDDSEPLCSACMGSAYSLSTAITLSPSPDHTAAACVPMDLSHPSLSHASLSHSNSSSVSETDAFLSSAAVTIDAPTVQGLIMAGTTPHTGARMAGGSAVPRGTLRRACSMNFVVGAGKGGVAAGSLTKADVMARVTSQRL